MRRHRSRRAGRPLDGVPLRVLVNTGGLGLGGGGTFIVEQLAALSRLEGMQITAVAGQDMAERLRAACTPQTRIRRLPASLDSLPVRLLFEQLLLPLHARAYDVVYQPGGFALFASPRPQVVTNQNPHHFGIAPRAFWRERYPTGLRLLMDTQRRVARASVRRAEAFVTVSAAFQAFLEEEFGHRPNVHMIASAPPRLPELAAPGDPFGLGEAPYIFTAAHDYIHKDWDGLIATFLEHRDLPRLVVAGAPRDRERGARLQQMLSGSNAGRVVLLGPVADRSRLAALYRGATCFVAHSFLEAGPLTPGEAITTGLRLVLSDISPHREAGGDRALYYEPRDLAGLAAAVRRTAAGEAPAATPRRVPERTWDENAAELAALLARVSRERRASANSA